MIGYVCCLYFCLTFTFFLFINRLKVCYTYINKYIRPIIINYKRKWIENLQVFYFLLLFSLVWPVFVFVFLESNKKKEWYNFDFNFDLYFFDYHLDDVRLWLTCLYLTLLEITINLRTSFTYFLHIILSKLNR